MGTAKNIIVQTITAHSANALIKKYHYSGKTVNSQIHFGVFYESHCEGAMQFGPSMDKRKIQGLVDGTAWHEFLELNRMAFSEKLPRNSESRALSIAFHLLKKNAPQIKWIISFADASQCGDGTIYRAAGFILTGIKKNTQIVEFPDGQRFTRFSLTQAGSTLRLSLMRKYNIPPDGSTTMSPFIAIGARPVSGYQLRYIYFLDKSYRERLTVAEIPYSKIKELNANMYKGKRLCVESIDSDAQEFHS